MACVTLISMGSCLAQDNGTATGTGDGGDTGGGAQFTPEEVDVSAFDQIERGDTLGGSSASNLGNVGDDANTGGFGGGGGGGIGGFGGLGGLFGGLGGAFGGNQGAGSQRPIIRVRLRSAVNVAPMADSSVQLNANRRLVSLPTTQRLPNVRVAVNDGTALMTGTVKTERERRMSQLLMRLEPGVKRVENRIVVTP
ncbi:MAG: BON domain-containing protein [Planctomycetota bacterium]